MQKRDAVRPFCNILWRESRVSELVADLVGPEALQAAQSIVDALEILSRNAADLLDRADVLLVNS